MGLIPLSSPPINKQHIGYKIDITNLNINELLKKIEKASDIKWIKDNELPTEYIPSNSKYLVIKKNELCTSNKIYTDEILCLTSQDFINKCKKLVPKKKEESNMNIAKTADSIKNVDQISLVYMKYNKDGEKPYKIMILYNNGKEYSSSYKTEEEQLQNFNMIQKAMENNKHQKKEGFNMIDKIKEQYKKHEDILFPLLVIWALDYFFNDGRFQHKITSVVENILDKVTSKFTKDINTKELPSGDK